MCTYSVILQMSSLFQPRDKSLADILIFEVAVGFLRYNEWGPVFQCDVSVLLFALQASLGGRVRLMITGAAPVSPTILTFLRAALGCQVSHIHKPISLTVCFLINNWCFVTSNTHCFPQFYEGYGQTECTAGCTMSIPGDWTAGKSQHIQ